MSGREIHPGQIVCSRAGRDTGRFFVVLALAGGGEYALLADGKVRRLASPKRKKAMHLSPTGRFAEPPPGGWTDRRLRAELTENEATNARKRAERAGRAIGGNVLVKE